MAEKTHKPDSDREHSPSVSAESTARPAPTPKSGSTPTVQETPKRQYIVGQTSGLLAEGVSSFDIHTVEQALKNEPDIEFVRTIAPNSLSALSIDEAQARTILVARMTEDRARVLKQSGGDRLLIEPDLYLHYRQPVVTLPDDIFQDLSVVVANGLRFEVNIVVQNEQGEAIPKAHVYLYGLRSSTDNLTDEQGQVHLTLLGETGEGLRVLYIEPAVDYWDQLITSPQLDPANNNLVTLKAFDGMYAGFPDQQLMGWGQKAMKLDRLPPSYTGTGVKVAVIDSGAATTHHDLQGPVKGGYDFTEGNGTTWNQDTVFHGTHCTGIVAGMNDDYGIRGFAPGAEVYALKILPGGQFSDLIEALEKCIELQVGVVNLSIGSDQPSQLVEQSIQKAKDNGVACIAAAGNSDGSSYAVEYPGSSPNVLAVTAIGQQNTFPPDTRHATQVFTGQGNPFTSEGYFLAKFSCFGPEVGVCAPGVAIISSVPPNNFAAWDGTSMATPHVTGLAALILAHHPDFQAQGLYAKPDGQRVERLFQILKQSAQSIALGDPQRVGAGLPDALAAFGLSAGATTSGVGQQVLDVLQKLAALAGKQSAVNKQNVAPTPVGALSSQSLEGGQGETIDTQLQKLELQIRQAGL